MVSSECQPLTRSFMTWCSTHARSTTSWALSREHRLDALAMLTICCGYALLVALANPSGHFALNDDWGYSTPIRWWMEDRVFRLTHWQSMTLVAQLALGIVWSEIFGFGYLGLRLLVGCLGAIALVCTYVLGRALGLPRVSAAVLPGMLVASPIFFTLSLSFMTDVPSLCVALVALLFFFETLSQSSKPSLVLFLSGTGLLLFALLIRETAVGLAAGYASAELYRQRGAVSRSRRAAVVVVLSAVLIGSFQPVLSLFSEIPTALNGKSESMFMLLSDATHLSLGALRPALAASSNLALYAGLFALPLVPFLLLQWMRDENRRAFFAVAVGCGVLLLGSVWVQHSWLPLATSGNALTLEGAGPRLIAGAHDGPQSRWPLLTVCGCASAGVLASALVLGNIRLWTNRAESHSTRTALILLAVTALASYLPYCLFYGAWFDRYALLPSLLLSLCALVVTPRPNPNQLVAWLPVPVIAFGACCSTALVHDLFAWQRARYDLIEAAARFGEIEPNEIDGGFEYNNLSFVLAHPAHAVTETCVRGDGRPYRLSKTPLNHHVIVDAVSTRELLSPKRKIFLLCASDQTDCPQAARSRRNSCCPTAHAE